mmetsp:Transcript_8852/g.13212  ORF Transcript_8852/g.13212 Transcript_8852/m.13212 type:complete len:156 (-) Transcript_8852:203-670(-)|eukprot:CAMPEP_0167748524 /NCGR_PEP_ID=MMETSP0110_2-20121227/4884_1 /TAXON_ID=629695 /ORGANISM="Gymnochlora sp., Strain CCMP2014" /LENGTH=155 /DNA_ID=CAMNT_0007633545 /DNA_START=12 /DNA_END=482 /DNA_ORIENTATION=-
MPFLSSSVSRKRKTIKETDEVEEVVKVRKWEKKAKTFGKMVLMKWTAVTEGERRIVPRNQLRRKKKKVFERLQRNTNQPLTRAMRSQLTDSGYSVGLNEEKKAAQLLEESTGGQDMALPNSFGSEGSLLSSSLFPSTANQIGSVFSEAYLSHSSL